MEITATWVEVKEVSAEMLISDDSTHITEDIVKQAKGLSELHGARVVGSVKWHGIDKKTSALS